MHLLESPFETSEELGILTSFTVIGLETQNASIPRLKKGDSTSNIDAFY